MQTSWMLLQLLVHSRLLTSVLKTRVREGLVISFSLWLLIVTSHPSMVNAQSPALHPYGTVGAEVFVNTMRAYGNLPVAGEREPIRTVVVPATAYTSDPDETDDTPFITASGTTVRRGVIATNFLKIGTRVRIPDFYGDEVFVVEDRMNARYDKRIDIWMEEKQEARQFGIRQVRLEIF
ncbi:MAG: hypothetical protein UY81_C0018G0008 [Candidatus Giovannonibacteria bacterium GW2011_GWA2_53_7]|uniref:3D domain-containing protein n=1 Tax=Candidatus Giovannonibacteria bacterium GW2011_GWA2_53_7 TaxID=1618650 RepID=A0A0G2AUY3_9BACT|nr:MAG: hypothetical protein UY81_C0018G0008 [Candidatus Giovannonibacteria bacterium GW2011_GWA2_53_7]